MLGRALRLIRRYHELTQEQLASRIGISKSFVSEIESGDKRPSLDVIESYSAEFKIPVSSIMIFSEQLERRTSTSNVRSLISRKVLAMLEAIDARAEAD